MDESLSYLTLKAWDTINGAAGMCYSVIDGIRENMIYVKDIDATIDKEKSEIKVLGQTGIKYKANGWKGTGKMTMYYATTKYREQMLKYIKTGVDTYFDLIIENYDPTSEIGTQKVILKQVNINNTNIAKLDINSTELDETVEFTFNDVEIISDFDQVVGE